MTASPSAAAFLTCSGAQSSEGDDGQELDRRDGAERQAVDRDVEAHVHRREDDRECDDRLSRGAVGSAECAPRSSPECEDRGGARDPQPCDSERLDAGEEEHRERGPEVVEDALPTK